MRCFSLGLGFPTTGPASIAQDVGMLLNPSKHGSFYSGSDCNTCPFIISTSFGTAIKALGQLPYVESATRQPLTDADPKFHLRVLASTPF